MIKRLMYLTFLCGLWLGGINIKTVISSALMTILIIYIIIPLFFHYCSPLQRHLVFLPYVNYPRKVDFNNPNYPGLIIRNFYLETEPNVNVGVWQILPTKYENEDAEFSEDYFKSKVQDGEPIVLYLHGNTSFRGSPHRVKLYQVLTQMNWHVFAFDYRGYADSSKVRLNENGVVHDAKIVFKHIRSMAPNSPIVVWGHSLGTGVASHSMGDLCLSGDSPIAVILESPFNSISDEIRFHPLTAIYRKMPWFEWLFLEPLKNINVEFNSQVHLTKINCPILILHAEDDFIVPYSLGKKLYEFAQLNRPTFYPAIEFKGFDATLKYAHKDIYQDKDLPNYLREFLRKNVKAFNEKF